MAETTLERAQRQYEQAKARLSAARAREASAERKRDTRRKVILGGALIDLATRDDRALAMLNRLIDNLTREQDKASFEGWERPGCANGQDGTGHGAPQSAAERHGAAGNGSDHPAPSNGSTGLPHSAGAMHRPEMRRDSLT